MDKTTQLSPLATLVDVARANTPCDTFLCLEKLDELPPARIAPFRRWGAVHVLRFEAVEQWSRLHQCWSTAAAQPAGSLHGYAWYIRARPDLLVLSMFPRVDQLSASCVHAKYKAVVGLPHTVAMRQSLQCECHDDAKAGACRSVVSRSPCSLVGDQMFAVPTALANASLASQAAQTEVLRELPAGDLSSPCINRRVYEERWDAYLRARGVAVCPLAVNTLLPKHTRFRFACLRALNSSRLCTTDACMSSSHAR